MSSATIWVVVYPAIWLAVYGTRDVIAGLTRDDLVTYFVCVLIMEYMTQSYVEEDLHEQIRDGKVSSILLKPVDFIRYFFFLHTGYRVLPLTIYLLLLFVSIIFLNLPFTFPEHLSTYVLWIVAIVMGNVLAFNLKMILSCAAFWIEEAEPLRAFYWIISNVFLGWVGPLIFLPLWFQHLSAALPWQYTLYVPVMIFLEAFTTRQLVMNFLVTGAWLCGAILLRRWVVRLSLRRFNAVGH